MAPIRRLAVIANLTRPRAQEGLVAFAKAAREAGVDFAVDPRSAKAFATKEQTRSLPAGREKF